MAADAVNGDVDRIDVGIGVAAVKPMWPISSCASSCKPSAKSGFGKSLVKSVLQQRLRAADASSAGWPTNTIVPCH